MRNDIAKELNKKAAEVAKRFSNEEREKNTNKELFSVKQIKVLSEFTAAVIYIKHPGEKLSVAFFYWVNMNSGSWFYFFPTDSHLLGIQYLHKIKRQIEEKNFDKN